MDNPFRPARRAQARLRLALTGPANAGKTYSALLLAKGIGGRIALVDTERSSAALYADVTPFDTMDLEPPYSPQRYIDAIRAAESCGYDILVIDSLSHAWAGEGGLLSLHDKAMRADPRTNGFAAWRHVTPQHNALVDAMLGAQCHIIATMRSKVAWEVTEDDRGRAKPVKIGLAPVQREGMEYEFTTVLDLEPTSHYASASKDRTRLFSADQPVLLTEDHGRALLEWLNAGVDVRAELRARLIAAREAGGAEGLREAARAEWRVANRDTRNILMSLHQELSRDLGDASKLLEDEPRQTMPIEEAAAARAKRLRGEA